MEEEIKDAIGLGSPQIEPEPKPDPEREARHIESSTWQTSPSIYDLGKVLAENEP